MTDPALPARPTRRRAPKQSPGRRSLAFTLTDLLVGLATLSVLTALLVPLVVKTRAKTKLVQCLGNLNQVNRAVLQFANEHGQALPLVDSSPAPGGWWWYKEQVKSYVGLTGASSAKDRVFACPEDRGYGDSIAQSQPFFRSAKHDFTSYVFNGVNLPGVPNIAGWKLPDIREPSRTLLTMEWTAHAPLSWHRSLTGLANTPFYTDAESTVGFVDGHVSLIKLYYDGLNAAYTRDPIPGYEYRYSGE
jgi:prepilin-type processing-associated H-X9-DG protein